VFPPNKPTHKHHIANHTAKKWLSPLFGFGHPHAPEKSQGLDRKNTIVGKVRGKAATATNMGLAQWRHYLAWTDFAIFAGC